jgi:hypothetical protein
MNSRGWVEILVLCMENAKVCGHPFLESVSQVSGLSCQILGLFLSGGIIILWTFPSRLSFSELRLNLHVAVF